ncbi:Muscle M-line assembly protein unc-89, partial [Pseudolycoriella hygida]
RTTAAGSSIKLTCSFSGPNVRIAWLKDGNLLEHGSKYAIFDDDGLSALEIQHSTVQDSGIYVCIASNSNGEVETSSIVTIYEKASAVLTTPPIFSCGIRDEFGEDLANQNLA